MPPLDNPDTPAGVPRAATARLPHYVRQLATRRHGDDALTVATEADLLRLARCCGEVIAESAGMDPWTACSYSGPDSTMGGDALRLAEDVRHEMNRLTVHLEIYDDPPGIGSPYSDFDNADDEFPKFVRWLGRRVKPRGNPPPYQSADATPADGQAPTPAADPAGRPADTSTGGAVAAEERKGRGAVPADVAGVRCRDSDTSVSVDGAEWIHLPHGQYDPVRAVRYAGRPLSGKQLAEVVGGEATDASVRAQFGKALERAPALKHYMQGSGKGRGGFRYDAPAPLAV